MRQSFTFVNAPQEQGFYLFNQYFKILIFFNRRAGLDFPCPKDFRRFLKQSAKTFVLFLLQAFTVLTSKRFGV